MGIFGASWLTTVVGIVGALARIIVALANKGTIEASDVTEAMTILALGGAAKSFNVSSGPKGMQGETGAPGPRGPTGPTGPTE